jgi:hypothetical protein
MEDEVKVERDPSRKRAPRMPAPAGFVWSHVIPRSMGGADTPDNVVLVSAEENIRTADRILRDHRLAPELRPDIKALAADMKRTADGIAELVNRGSDSTDRRIAVFGIVIGAVIGLAGIAVAIWSVVH